jgi:hypothetical protein
MSDIITLWPKYMVPTPLYNLVKGDTYVVAQKL